MRPLTPREFADAAIDLPLDQAHALIIADLDAELAAIIARHTPEAEHGQDADVLALPETPAHTAEEAA